MPYKSNAELPAGVRGALPAAAQSRYREVVNNAFGRGLSESAAHGSAWTAVKNGWAKGKGGTWSKIKKHEGEEWDSGVPEPDDDMLAILTPEVRAGIDAAMANAQVSREHDIYLCGNRTMDLATAWLDKDLPETIDADGAEINVDQSAGIHHEIPEGYLQNMGIEHRPAHIIATHLYEKPYVISQGGDFGTYQQAFGGVITANKKKFQDDNGPYSTPDDMDHSVFEQNDVDLGALLNKRGFGGGGGGVPRGGGGSRSGGGSHLRLEGTVRRASAARQARPPAARASRVSGEPKIGKPKTHNSAFHVKKPKLEHPVTDIRLWEAKKVDDGARTMFVSRQLMNSHDLVAWAKNQGFATTTPPDEMHVTLAYSKQPTAWPEMHQDEVIVPSSPNRMVQPLGPNGAVVLRFNSDGMQERWQEFCANGASWDFDGFNPHVTITWDAGDTDLSHVAPYDGPLIFGPEQVQEIDENWMDEHVEKSDMAYGAFEKAGARHSAADRNMLQQIHDHSVDLGASCSGVQDAATSKRAVGRICKIDDEQGIVYGYALICKVNGQDYYDVQQDHIPEGPMISAALDYVTTGAIAKEMHVGEAKGRCVFVFPLTTDLAKAFGITTPQTGLMIGYKPDDKAILAKFRSGPNGEPPEYTGFSIGGMKFEVEEAA